jgi:hypothetical protein
MVELDLRLRLCSSTLHHPLLYRLLTAIGLLPPPGCSSVLVLLPVAVATALKVDNIEQKKSVRFKKSKLEMKELSDPILQDLPCPLLIFREHFHSVMSLIHAWLADRHTAPPSCHLHVPP